ncbi:MAG: nucleoside deaminase [Dolichospermum lemmermannii FEM_B0920]|nr:nucleoside deaminase [Dolichospermum sp. DEX182a]
MSNFSQPYTINNWKKWLESYQPNLKYPDDTFALEVCKLALQAVELGNFGIGCVLVDTNSNIIVKEHNQVFHPYFHSARHGEMVVMDSFEETYKEVTSMRGYTLYTSLESCPMCMARLITSRCEKVIHVANDPTGGMVHLKENLPSVWIELAQKQTFAKAKCSRELKEAAHLIFMLNAKELNERLNQRLDT